MLLGIHTYVSAHTYSRDARAASSSFVGLLDDAAAAPTGGGGSGDDGGGDNNGKVLYEGSRTPVAEAMLLWVIGAFVLYEAIARSRSLVELNA